MTQAYPGPLGRVDERLPHSECDTCFTVPVLDRYQIFEQIETDGGEVLLPRMIPNPAPLRVNEIRERYDEETGEDIWYIGTQVFVGPTDEDYWSDEAPLPTIELQRIQMQHRDDSMSIPGVHGFGIGPVGFVVFLTPEEALSSEQIPLSLDGAPVEVKIQEMMTLAGHSRTRFRPIPAGAGISTYVRTPSGRYIPIGGALGPHVVRDRPHVGGCCQLWSLTAAHTVKYRLSDANPTGRAVYQPWTGRRPSPADHFGDVAHAFQLTRCDTPSDQKCTRRGAPANWTHTNPDIAAIDHGFRAAPFNDPTGTDPTRRLQYADSGYHNGPSGKILNARRRHRHKIWGAFTPATNTSRVTAIDICTTVRADHTTQRYQMCGLNVIGGSVRHGDSGALVAYAGTSNRHVAGVLVAGNTLGIGAVYVPANDIKMAFRNVRKEFSHFWGTKSSYQAPSTRTCDPPGC